jgi:hypothetical protein
MLAIVIGYIIMFYGLLKSTGWSWIITTILIIIGIGIQIVSGAVGFSQCKFIIIGLK